MMTIHIFGKSSGCQKCHALRQRVERILQEEPYRDSFCVEFHDLLTEDGLVPFCMANINPNRVPAVVIGDDGGFVVTPETEEMLKDRAKLYPYLGICTDYSEDGHKGVIYPDMIRELLDGAMKP